MGRQKPQGPKYTKEFLELQKEWYDKLEASGFKDAEFTDHKNGKFVKLKQNSSVARFNDPRRPANPAHEKQRYYELARQYLHNEDFSPWEHFVWHCYSEGYTQTETLAEIPPKSHLPRLLKALKTRFLEWVKTTVTEDKYGDE